jgi:hypothetical protein
MGIKRRQEKVYKERGGAEEEASAAEKGKTLFFVFVFFRRPGKEF